MIQGPDLEENGRWRQIREMDYKITKNYPEQVIDSPLLVPYDSPRERAHGADANGARPRLRSEPSGSYATRTEA